MSSSSSQVRSLLLPAAVVIVLTAAGLLVSARRSAEPSDEAIVWQVRRRSFLHEIVEKGEVESGSNVEVRCEVKARGIRRGPPPRPGERGRESAAAGVQTPPSDPGGHFMILEVVPEGTSVRKGDVLVVLDASTLKEELNDQQITCALAEAAVIRAKNDLESAQIALQEYREGLWPQRQQLLEDRVALETEALRQSRRNLELTDGLLRRGFVTGLQREADRYASDQAQIALSQTQTAEARLRKYSGPKTVAELEAAVEVAGARLQAETSNYRLSQGKLEELKQQIEKCRICAPLPGKVIYANKVGMSLQGPQIVIEPGTTVRDGQTIVMLPNPESMQVKVLVDEANLPLVQPGQPANFAMDALPGIRLSGQVTKVNSYPEPTSDPLWAVATRQYEATVSIERPPANLRPGMTAEVRICVCRLDARLQVPQGAVLRRADERICVVRRGGKFDAMRVKVGPSNGRFSVVESGLQEGDLVVLAGSRYVDRTAGGD